MKGSIPSYFKRESATIFVSDVLKDDSYVREKIIAHELGHFFLDDSSLSAMNDDELNDYLPEENMKEYDANVFAIFLMPQIMKGRAWQNYNPKKLNIIAYRTILELR